MPHAKEREPSSRKSPPSARNDQAAPSHTTSNRIDLQAASLRHHARRAQERAELDEGQLEGLEHPAWLGSGLGLGFGFGFWFWLGLGFGLGWG